MTTEHALVLCVALSRAMNQLNFYYLFQYLPALATSLLSGLPYLFLSWSDVACTGIPCLLYTSPSPRD